MSNRRKPYKIENRIYIWLLKKEEHLREHNEARSLEELEKIGVPWRSSSLFDEDPSEAPLNLSVSASKALGRLRDEGMIETAGNTDPQKQYRASHVKLTHRGYVKAIQTASRELRERQVPKLTLKAARQRITNEIDRYESLGKSTGRLLKTASSAKSRFSLHSNGESAEFSREDLRQIAVLADEAVKQQMRELRSHLKQLAGLER